MKSYCLKLVWVIICATILLPIVSQKALAKDSYGLTWTVAATPSAVAIDSSNNIYYAGYLASGSAVELNPTPIHLPSDIRTATTGAIFLTRLDSDLTYNVSHIIEAATPKLINGQNISVSLTKMATDSAQNVWLLGSFNGNVNFDPTGSLDFHSSNNETWPFLLKMNADGTYGGTYLWQNNNIVLRDMVIKNNDVYLLGQAVNNGGNLMNINLNPLGGKDIQTLSADSTLGFYTKLTDGTVYSYSRTVKNNVSKNLEMDHLALDSDNNVFLYGVFATTMNFNGSGGTDNKTANGGNDLFLSKYNSSGMYVLTYVVGGSGFESAGALGIDNDNNIYYTGGFNNTVDFNPTERTDNRTADPLLPDQRFLSKLNSDGTYGYTLIWNSNNLSINKIAFDQNNLIYLVGLSAGTTNYDPITVSDSQLGFGGNDAFMTVINPNKTYNYTYVWGGTNDDKAIDAAFDSLNDFYITGSTKSLGVNFDPTGQSSITTTLTGGENGYLTEFSTIQSIITPTPTPALSNTLSSKFTPQGIACTNPAPLAPRIFQITATRDKSTLSFIPNAGAQNNYTISYGPYSDATMHNISFDYSAKSGTIPYTIGSLEGNTTYYFKVRANNGCMPGEWSKILSIKTPPAER